MATTTRLRIDLLSDDELAIQLWQLAMAGDRGSDAFTRIDAEVNRRKSSQCRPAITRRRASKSSMETARHKTK